MFPEPFASDPLLARFAVVERGAVRALVRRDHLESAERLGLLTLPSSGRSVAGGRQSHPLVELPDGTRAVLRRYRRGGALRHLNRDRYFLGHRALEELRATERARRAGVAAPEVLAAVERRMAVGYTAVLATRWIAGAVEMAGWLAGAAPAERREAAREAGRQAAAMHAAGVAHPDLNLRNLLVSPGAPPAVHLIDFDRARLFDGPVPPARRARDLLRLARSARKLRAPLDAADWAALREGYGAAWPLPSDLG